MFCVECGKECEVLHEGGVCSECFLGSVPLEHLPKILDVDLCVHCHSRKRGRRWIPSLDPSEAVRESVREALELKEGLEDLSIGIEVELLDEHSARVHLSLSGRLEGVAFSRFRVAEVRLRGSTCTRCSRRKGGYYESIVQVRGSSSPPGQKELEIVKTKVEESIRSFERGGDYDSYFLKEVVVPGGIDLYFGTVRAGRLAARSLSSALGCEVEESAKLVGRKEGRDLYRVTFLVRIPPFRVGDLIVHKEEPFLVLSLSSSKVRLLSLLSGREGVFDREEIERSRVVPDSEVREAVVVERGGREIQILDPWSLRTIPLLLPSGIDPPSSTCRVMRHEGEIFLVPDRSPSGGRGAGRGRSR